MTERVDSVINQRICVHYKVKPDFNIKTTDELLALMELYLSEWEHRDNLFWKQIFIYFFSTLVMMLLPFMDPWGLNLPDGLPNWLFQCIGLVMAFVFFIVSRGYIARLKALSDPYRNLIEKLPLNYRRKTVKELYPNWWGTVLNFRMASLVCSFMTISLLLIGSALLYFAIT